MLDLRGAESVRVCPFCKQISDEPSVVLSTVSAAALSCGSQQVIRLAELVTDCLRELSIVVDVLDIVVLVEAVDEFLDGFGDV